MFRNFYKFFIDTKLNGKDLFDNLNLADKYGKIRDNRTSNFVSTDKGYVFPVNENDRNEYRDEPIFFKVNAKDDSYCCFYDNLMFTFYYENETKDKITRIYVKSPNDEWTFVQSNDVDAPIDLLHPIMCVPRSISTTMSVSLDSTVAMAPITSPGHGIRCSITPSSLSLRRPRGIPS